MPETLQGIVSARLDTLSTAEKAVLQDGAVMGKVFWTGAVRPPTTPDRCCSPSHGRAS